MMSPVERKLCRHDLKAFDVVAENAKFQEFRQLAKPGR
jgi:hypothetical protein